MLPGALPIVGRSPPGRPAPRAPRRRRGDRDLDRRRRAGGRGHGRSRSSASSCGRTRSRSPSRCRRRRQHPQPRRRCRARATRSSRPGASLTAARIGALAACGIETSRAHRRHGSRSSSPAPSCARRASRSSRARSTSRTGSCSRARSQAAGAVVERLAAAEDTEEALGARARAALEADVLVTSGGVSVGPHDLVRRVEARSASRRSSGASRCGRASRSPSASAARRSSSGCPGNPVSSLVGALLFVPPALLALQGASRSRRRRFGRARCPAGRPRPERDDFVRAQDHLERGRRRARPDRRSGVAHDRPDDGRRRDRPRPARRRSELAAGTPIRYLPL